ncbi:hypothetical protein OEW28_12290 [Defluviimonas sp. WL0002]|uniref:Fenitrothion hydrolase n=1 Tax=Albidovulum marisflavi TaxID=2984159 RepID=A0ABT2ZE47_9RHOB|nr:hypothetical protein [Defluviimonas sp. WL0002]MCV2869405.1 hypothetical protein [Defluviimonas sp. WL0002]
MKVMAIRFMFLGLAALGLPGVAFAHATQRAVLHVLPTAPYVIGAGIAVALSALIVAFAPRVPAPRAVTLLSRPVVPRDIGSWLSALLLVFLLAAGFFGSRDPYGNMLTLTVWVVLWVALTLAVAVFGDLWRGLDPWSGPVRAARRMLGLTGGVGLSRLGHWPAVAGYLAFAWFEIVSLAPADPAVLARTALAYWLVVFALAVAEGEHWLEKGEFLTVYFGFVSKIAPLWAERRDGRLTFHLGWPGAQILGMPPLSLSQAAFVTAILASVSFDGLHETFWWLARIGINPLDVPGRSAVMGVNTAGLFLTWAAMAGLIAAAIRAELALSSPGAPRYADAAGPYALSFLPIATGYHVAHYLVALLTSGQYVLVALNDPFDLGWALLGLPEHWVGFGFLARESSVRLIWQAQWAIILTAHLLAVLLAAHLARRSGLEHRRIAQLPVAVLMVLYTVFGLWLLSAPAAG